MIWYSPSTSRASLEVALGAVLAMAFLTRRWNVRTDCLLLRCPQRSRMSAEVIRAYQTSRLPISANSRIASR